MKIISKYFGEIDATNLEECYESEIKLNNTDVEIDIWFEEEDKIDETTIKKADLFLDKIISYQQIAQNTLDEDIKNNNVVKEYLEFHLEELDASELSKFNVDTSDDIEKQMKQLYQKIKLVRVGLYPTYAFGCEEFAVFDFTLSRDITDQLLVVKTSDKGDVLELTTES